jgi:aryl-alcohol dehydrogenase-like predicted oxidoreductase
MHSGWTAGESASFAIVDAHQKAGGNLIDTAEFYSHWADGNPGGVSEETAGNWVKARANCHDIVQAAVAWLSINPLVTAPIAGANSVEQLSESLAAVEFRLTDEEMGDLDGLSDWQSR